MRFILLAVAFAASLVSAASEPRAAGAPVALRQATRKQVVRRVSSKGMRKRQSMPSGGVYPVCDGSPSSGARKFAVIDKVEIVLPPNTQPLQTPGNTQTALVCATQCINTSGCLASQFTLTANPETDINCVLYPTYQSARSNDAATTTYAGFTCSEIQAEFEVGDLTCCTYYAD